MLGKKMLQKALFASFCRRVAGYLGVAGMVGFENDLTQLGGMIVAAATYGWSIYCKVKLYRQEHGA